MPDHRHYRLPVRDDTSSFNRLSPAPFRATRMCNKLPDVYMYADETTGSKRTHVRK